MSANTSKENFDLKDFKKKNGLSMEASLDAEATKKKEIITYLKTNSIIPIWASIKEIMHTPTYKGCLLDADVETLIANSNFDKRKIVDKPNKLTIRHMKILEVWIKKNATDPIFCNYTNEIDILDGNHRLALCKFLNVSQIRVFVPMDAVSKFQNIFNFKVVEIGNNKK